MIKYFAPMIFLLLVVSLALTTCKYQKKARQVESLNTSLEKSGQDLKYFTTESRKLAARNDALVLTNRELLVMFPSVINEIRNLKVNPAKVEHFTETVICQEKQIVQSLRDSIIRDTIKAKVFDYHDAFYDVTGMAFNDTQRVNIKSRDSIIQVVYRGERLHKWLWILSRRKLQQVITSKNPNSKIVYCRDIEIIN